MRNTGSPKSPPHHLEPCHFGIAIVPHLHMALHLAPAGQLPEQAQLLLAFYGYADGVKVRIRYKHVKSNGRNKKRSDGGKKTIGLG